MPLASWKSAGRTATVRRVTDSVRRWLIPVLPEALRVWFFRRLWENRWQGDSIPGPWYDRDISSEIVDAVESGWFPPGKHAIDLGCGRGDVAAWLATHGFLSVGIDIAPSAIRRARERHGEAPGLLAYFVADVCRGSWPEGTYDVLVDRGCFHQLAARDRLVYASTLRERSVDGARLLLFVKAYRDDRRIGEAKERDRRTREVERAFEGAFAIDRVDDTFLGPERTLPGIVFWMTRRA